MFSKVSAWWHGEQHKPQYKREHKVRQLETVDQINNTLNVLVTQQLQEEFKLNEINDKITANQTTWLKQGAAGKATLATHIRRRKDIEQSLRKMTGQIANLEKMQRTNQQAATHVAVAETMQQGNSMVSELTQHINVEEIEDIYDEFADHVQDIDEIGEATSRPILSVHGADIQLDDDIAAEIAAMEEAIAQDATADMPSITETNNQNVKIQTNEKESINEK